MTAIDDIATERHRQISEEEWSLEHDDRHIFGQLAVAAACYAYNAAFPVCEGVLPTRWPWSAEWWKPKDARRDLVRAGALIVAEIERLDRALHQRETTKRAVVEADIAVKESRRGRR